MGFSFFSCIVEIDGREEAVVINNDALIEQLQQREQAGLEEFSRRFTPLMRYIISPILPDEQDREECLADVSLLVWEQIERYDPNRGAFTTWLTVLTRNTALNRLRRCQRRTAAQVSLVPLMLSL